MVQGKRLEGLSLKSERFYKFCESIEELSYFNKFIISYKVTYKVTKWRKYTEIKCACKQ